MPIALSVTGHYFRIAKFMHLLRTRAKVKDGKVHASGRLYAIDNISFSSGDKGLITATLALDAFMSGPPTPARPLRRYVGDHDDHHGAVDGLGGGSQAPEVGAARARLRREAAPPD